MGNKFLIRPCHMHRVKNAWFPVGFVHPFPSFEAVCCFTTEEWLLLDIGWFVLFLDPLHQDLYNSTTTATKAFVKGHFFVNRIGYAIKMPYSIGQWGVPSPNDFFRLEGYIDKPNAWQGS